MCLSELERQAVRVAPWLWPALSVYPEDFEKFRKFADVEPPEPQIGSVLLVAVSDKTASLWGLNVQDATTDLASGARLAWEDALLAVARVAKVLWKLPDGLLRPDVRCRKLAVHLSSGQCEPDERVVGAVDGRSFGLPFLLAIASRLFELPVSAEVAATGDVGPDGTVSPVAEVFLKTQAVMKKARAVCRWLVPAANQAEAELAALGTSVRIVPVSTAAEALEEVFGDRPIQRFRELALDKERRPGLVRGLFHLACAGSQIDVNWGAVAKAAKLLQETGVTGQDDAFLLAFARGVSLRHIGNSGDIPVPTEKELARFPAPVRCTLVAHLLQHCADTGTPTSEQAVAIAQGCLVQGKEAFGEHLTVLAALGRLLAVCGKPQEALEAEVEAVEGFCERFLWSEVSRPLSMALRLAGVLGDKARYERLDALRRNLVMDSRLGRQDTRFVNLANGVACVALGLLDAEAARGLVALARDLGAPDHVRFSAMRWAMKWARERGEEGIARELKERLGEFADAGCPDALLFQCLARLDENPDDDHVIERLSELDGGVMGHLTRAARSVGWPIGLYVRNFYPY